MREEERKRLNRGTPPGHLVFRVREERMGCEWGGAAERKEEKRKRDLVRKKYIILSDKILRLDGFGNEATLIYAILAVYRSGQDSQ